MSVQAMAWVFDHSQATLGARLVALSVANHADKHGREARAAVATYAAEAHLSVRQAHRALRTLEDDLGEIRRYGTFGKRADRQTVIYEFPGLVDGVTERHTVDADGVTSETPRGDTEGSHGVTPTSHKPSLNRPEPTTANIEFAFVCDAIKKACGLKAELTDREDRKVALAATSIRKTGFEPHSFTAAESEVERRARNYVRRYPSAQLTPMALANHWGECDEGPGRRDPAASFRQTPEPDPEALAAFAAAAKANPWKASA